MLKNAPFTNVGFPKEKIFDICWCQNPRLLEGFHQLFHKSVLASLFHPLSGCFSRKSDKKKGVPGAAQCGSVDQNMPLYTEKKENLLLHQKCNFCEANFTGILLEMKT